MNVKKIALICAVACVMSTGIAQAANNKDAMIAHYWKRHERGIEEVLKVWQQGGADVDYAKPFYKIISAENSLNNFGVPYKNDRFVSALFNYEGHHRPGKDAYHIFLKRFKRQTGWEPSRQNIYKGKLFSVSTKGQRHKFTVKTD